ncbi:MAG: TetR/AcrR family transcriptional regulator C-terminal domain-containing protein [Oscillospiraceae bacterium]|jgi:probable dihydroxyacetone kinase regulator
MSDSTKQALADSLKKLASRKPLEKITVKDIVEDCNVNRQTFYYHFQDIYDLLDWMFKTDAGKLVDQSITMDNIGDYTVKVYEYLLANKTMVLNIYNSLSRSELSKYLENISYPSIRNMVAQQAEGMNVSDENINIIAITYTYGFIGIIMQWLDNKMKMDYEIDRDKFLAILSAGVTESLKKLSGT